MTDTKLELKPINDLLPDSFLIPDYQRGYRWTPTEVVALLDDIWKFRLENNKDHAAFYCLQPVVVAAGETGWIVIDGQQRLTTIHLIISYLRQVMETLGKSCFKIFYQTRPGSENFLNTLDLSQADDNIDNHHFVQAYRAIDKWFQNKDGNARYNFLLTLLNDDTEGKNVKVIWYEVGKNESQNHIDIFTRLNIGKIPLTNAELIKAILLQKSNFPTESAALKQIQIASEWDIIEQKLRHENFWYFIYHTSNPITYDTRIEYILDMLYGRTKDHTHYHTLVQFSDAAKQSRNKQGDIDIELLWMEIKRYFLTFEEWYNTPDLYHLTGFLVCCGEDIDSLKRQSQNMSKPDFKDFLQKEIAKQLASVKTLEELDYDSHRGQIKKVLLLFNIQTLRTNNSGTTLFPFDLYKTQHWDIEHIRSQTDKDIDKRYRRDWIADLFELFAGKSLSAPAQTEGHTMSVPQALGDGAQRFCPALLELFQAEVIDDAKFQDLRREISVYFHEETPEASGENKGSIGNLALLDAATNRSYGNALFPVKRRHIIDHDGSGRFIPLCTKNAFLKYYSHQLDEVMYWKNTDAADYTLAIKQTLKEFLPNPTLHE